MFEKRAKEREAEVGEREMMRREEKRREAEEKLRLRYLAELSDRSAASTTFVSFRQHVEAHIPKSGNGNKSYHIWNYQLLFFFLSAYHCILDATLKFRKAHANKLGKLKCSNVREGRRSEEKIKEEKRIEEGKRNEK